MMMIMMMMMMISGGARGHPDKGAAFPDGGLRQQAPKAGMGFLGVGSPLTTR